MSSGKSEI
jgi:hypothetical protein